MLPISAKHKNKRLLKLWVVIGTLILFALVSGCFQNYGRLKRDPEVTKAFDTNKVESDYQYFFYGRSNQPYIIVGIDRTYHMRSKMWREVDHNSERFRRMVYWIWDDILWGKNYIKGAHILDPQGNKVGLWYSHLWWAAIRFSDDNRIEIMPDVNGSGGAVR
jgi:hypothetical protein